MITKFPFVSALVDGGLMLAKDWQETFERIYNAVLYLGEEYTYQISNNVSNQNLVDAKGRPFLLDYRFHSCAFVEYVLQRVTNSNEKVESGIISVKYRPTSLSWDVVNLTSDSEDAGITFNMTADGILQYSTTNIAGTILLSRLVCRVRPIKAKGFYSVAG